MYKEQLEELKNILEAEDAIITEMMQEVATLSKMVPKNEPKFNKLLYRSRLKQLKMNMMLFMDVYHFKSNLLSDIVEWEEKKQKLKIIK